MLSAEILMTQGLRAMSTEVPMGLRSSENIYTTRKTTVAISKRALAVAVLLIVAVAAYWYWSPYVAMNSIRKAAQQGDAENFNRRVDFPKLRESLKGQFKAQMAAAMGDVSKSRSDAERAGGALGAMLGMTMADRMIDAMVSPEMAMKALSEGKLQHPSSRAKSRPQADQKDIKWRVERYGVDRVIAYGGQAGVDSKASDPSVGFVFDREGFATWKLSEIRLPSSPKP